MLYLISSNRSFLKQNYVYAVSNGFEIIILHKNNMQTGTIARLNNGYGFISQEGQEKDLFFHANELDGTAFDDLREGDAVQFEVGEGPKGPNAVKVSVVA